MPIYLIAPIELDPLKTNPKKADKIKTKIWWKFKEKSVKFLFIKNTITQNIEEI